MVESHNAMLEFRALQARWDAAHERAYTHPTPDVCEAQRQFEDDEIDIEAFEAVLDAADQAVNDAKAST